LARGRPTADVRHRAGLGARRVPGEADLDGEAVRRDRGQRGHERVPPDPRRHGVLERAVGRTRLARLAPAAHRRRDRRGHARSDLEDDGARWVAVRAMTSSADAFALEGGPATDRSRFARIPRFGLFTEDHDALRSTVRDWVARELRPHAEEWERTG